VGTTSAYGAKDPQDRGCSGEGQRSESGVPSRSSDHKETAVTTTLHIENTVRDYASWQETFDKFERFRADNGVQSYRICRRDSNPNEVTVDLEFGSREDAEAFVPKLLKIWSTPQSKEHLISHGAPELREVMRHRVLEASLP
jgi:ribosomal protein L35AE/L33A